MTIRLRLALLFTAAALVLLVGGGVLFATRLAKGLDHGLALTLRTRADNLATQIVGSRGKPEAGLARFALRGAAGGIYAQLLSRSGHVLDGSRFLGRQPLLTPTQVRLARRRGLLIDRTVTLVTADRESESMRILTRTVGSSGDVLAVALSRDVVDQAVSSARHELVRLGVAVLLLAGPGAWLLTGAALRPVERMRREVQGLGAGDAGMALRVPKTHDEISRLAETFNLVLTRMHAAVARDQALVADAGHELRTPLTVLKGELELARRPHRSQAELAHTVEVAAEETERLVRLTEDLLFLSRDEAADDHGLTQRFDVVAVIDWAVAAMAGAVAQRNARICSVGSSPVWCDGNREWIRRAVENLLTNAIRHAPSGSTIWVTTAQVAGSVRVTVSDEGDGFPPDFLPFAFDRFTRADDSRVRTPTDPTDGAGSGLGLAIVRAIVARHGGTATAANRPEGGAEVSLTWPLAEPPFPADRGWSRNRR